MDGIELEAYGHLLDQFVSPLTNDLEPPYGGSLDNRMRFAFDVLGEIRRRVGPDFIVGLRYTGDEMQEGGVRADEGFEISRRLRDSGLVDFLNVVRGHIDTDAGLTDVIPIQGMANAPHLDFAGEIRAATGFPVFHAAKISDVATARHAIASGKLDMVGMTRAHMTDPHIVRKILEGQEDRIRPCVGANYCLDRIYQGGAAYCIHNPATGRELTMPHVVARADTRKKVVIVGAGPAGMEAARVAGERGHEVTVLEAAGEAGGQIRLTAQSPRRREMLSIIDWRMAECERLGVEFRFNVWAEAEDVLARNPEVVIVATGGMPHTEVLTRGNELVVSAWDILSGDAKPGTDVLVYDDAGDHAGLQAAEIIAATGARVEIMTPDRSFAPEVMAMNLVPYMRSLQELDTTFTVTFRLNAVERRGNRLVAHIGSDYGGLAREREHRPGGGQSRDGAARRAVLRPEAAVAQPRRGLARRADRRGGAVGRPKSGGALPTVPHRRRSLRPQYPRGDLRCTPPGEGSVGRQALGGPPRRCDGRWPDAAHGSWSSHDKRMDAAAPGWP